MVRLRPSKENYMSTSKWPPISDCTVHQALHNINCTNFFYFFWFFLPLWIHISTSPIKKLLLQIKIVNTLFSLYKYLQLFSFPCFASTVSHNFILHGELLHKQKIFINCTTVFNYKTEGEMRCEIMLLIRP